MGGSSAWQSHLEASWLKKLKILDSISKFLDFFGIESSAWKVILCTKVLSPSLGQKAGFWNLDGYKMDNVLAIRPENGNVHTNFFMRIQL